MHHHHRLRDDMSEQVLHVDSYGRNRNTGEVHKVIVARGRIRMSGEACNLDDAEHVDLISDDEAWAAFRARPESWCGNCTTPPPDIEGVPV